MHTFLWIGLSDWEVNYETTEYYTSINCNSLFTLSSPIAFMSLTVASSRPINNAHRNDSLYLARMSLLSVEEDCATLVFLPDAADAVDRLALSRDGLHRLGQEDTTMIDLG
jgi:hypothetical protein